MMKNTCLEATKFRKIPKEDPRYFSPIYHNSLANSKIQNEILSLISWNANYSNHEFYLQFVHKQKYGSLFTVRLSK